MDHLSNSEKKFVSLIARILVDNVLKIAAMANDQTILSFGKHKNKPLKDVPDGWFIYMHDRGKLSAELKAYAEQRVPVLRFQAEKKKSRRGNPSGRGSNP